MHAYAPLSSIAAILLIGVLAAAPAAAFAVGVENNHTTKGTYVLLPHRRQLDCLRRVLGS